MSIIYTVFRILKKLFLLCRKIKIVIYMYIEISHEKFDILVHVVP